MKITAGLGSVDDYLPYVEAGADEFFCGYVPYEWMKNGGLKYPLNRREVVYYNVQIGSESEMEIPEGCYQVVLPQSTEYEISFCAETQWYQPGEEVSFTLEAVPGLEALEISA